ncbi:MAG: S49 family peptidase [Candidatus Sumerlaeia bacterium]|nr:S49 family peptidase [Candidatus Sumerlaeia bacterium]
MSRILGIAVFAVLSQVSHAFFSNPFTESADAPTTKSLMPVLILDGVMDERSTPFTFLDQEVQSLHDVIEWVDLAAKDEEVKALAVQIRNPMLGLSQTTELRNAFLRFRETEKPLLFFADSLTLKTYYLASSGEQVILPPVGGLFTYGFSFRFYYFKDMLEKLGMQAQVVNTGDYKNALEPFTHQEMTEGTREQFTAIQSDLVEYIGTAIGESRGMESDQLLETLFGGPHLSSKALELGLIDGVGYWESTLETFSNEKGFELDWEYDPLPKSQQAPPNLFALFTTVPKALKQEDTEPRIALVFAQGNIVDGAAAEDPFSQSQMIASDSFLEVLEDATGEGVKALVIRVDSGGGSAIASDRIWNKVQEIRTEKNIPVIVTMGNVAASGGYYMSMGADRIFVQPTTITGSIGVIAGRMVLGGTYSKLGVNMMTLDYGKNSWLENEKSLFTPEQVAFVEGLIMDTYKTFTTKASESRGISLPELEALAGGRVWTGVSAVKFGLVDELGGLNEAIEYARIKAQDGASLPVVEYPKPKTLPEILAEIMSGEMQTTSSNPELLKSLQSIPGFAPMKSFLGTLQVLDSEFQLLAVYSVYPEID